MKELIFTCCMLCCILSATNAQTINFSEVPYKVNYQGVARNAQGQPIASQPIKVRASLIAETETGTQQKFYSAVHSVTTNPVGLFSFQLDGNTFSNVTGSMTNSAWTNHEFSIFLQIELDVNNSGTYTDMGMQQIVSVPFAWIAQYAKTADKFLRYTRYFQASSATGQLIPVNSTGTTVSFENVELPGMSSPYGFNTSTNVLTTGVNSKFNIHAQVRVTHPGTPAANEAMQIQIKVNNIVRASTTMHLEKETTISVSALLDIYINDQIKIDVVPVNATAEVTVGALHSSHFYAYEIR
ncbi:MAG: hypothetical protein NVV59_12075 [Chitinophagaceae bacterium]|nr:hypothetical protein [Chitinophagaceae bacterium]